MKSNAGSSRLFPYCFLLAVSLYAAAFWLPDRTVPAGDWERLARAVREGFQPGDAIVLWPWWLGRAREYLGDLPVFQYRRPEREDWSTWHRLWLIELEGYRLGGPFADGSFRRESQQNFGKINLNRYFLGEPVKVVFDFRKELEHARVEVLEPAGPRLCSEWRGDRWQCSPREWNYIGRTIMELGDNAREVIWAHPVDYPTRITYSQVPGGRELLLWTGFSPAAVRARDGAPVTVRVFVDGQPFGKPVVQKNIDGYFLTRFGFSQISEALHTVAFEISTPHAGMRHFAFHAEVRR